MTSSLCLGLILCLGLSVPIHAQDSAAGNCPGSWAEKLLRARELMTAGKISEAIDVATVALAQAEKQVDDDEGLLQPLLFLSTLLIMDGKHDAAEPHSRRANEIAEMQLVKARTRVATTLKYLGAIYTQQAKLDDAQRVYERAVEISEEAVGPDHPETAKHVGNLGALLLRRNRTEEAEALLERSLAIWARQKAPDLVYTVGDLCNLAQLRMLQGRAETAIELHAEGVSIQEKAFGERDPRLQNTLRDYASMLRKAGRPDQAAEVESRMKR